MRLILGTENRLKYLKNVRENKGPLLKQQHSNLKIIALAI
jgi:hypothetical protein